MLQGFGDGKDFDLIYHIVRRVKKFPLGKHTTVAPIGDIEDILSAYAFLL